MTAIVGTSLGDPDNPFQPLLQFLATSTKTKESSTASSTMASVIVSKELYNPLTFNALLLMNVLSMFCSIGCILLVLCLRHRPGRARKWHTQPVSIRLILYASVIDIFYSTFRIYDMIISQADTRPDSQPNCEAAMFGITFFSLLSVFIRALFSVHLHAVIVLNANRPLGYEKLFVILSFALALVLALLPLTRFAYAWIDYDPTLESGHCSYFSLESVPHSTIKPLDYTMSDARKAVIAGVLWCWATYFGWVALTICYSILVIGAVIWRLWTERRRTIQLIAQHRQMLANGLATGQSNISRRNSNRPTVERTEINQVSADQTKSKPEELGSMLVFVRCLDGKEVWQLAHKVLRRVAQFPATIIICHSLEVAWATATLTRILPIVRSGTIGDNSDLKRLYVGMQVMLSLQGVITLMSLCLEPAVKATLQKWWTRLCKTQCNCTNRRAAKAVQTRKQTPAGPTLANTAGPDALPIQKRAKSGIQHQDVHTVGHMSKSPITLEDMPWEVIECKGSTSTTGF